MAPGKPSAQKLLFATNAFIGRTVLLPGHDLPGVGIAFVVRAVVLELGALTHGTNAVSVAGGFVDSHSLHLLSFMD